MHPKKSRNSKLSFLKFFFYPFQLLLGKVTWLEDTQYYFTQLQKLIKVSLFNNVSFSLTSANFKILMVIIEKLLHKKVRHHRRKG